MSTRDIISLYQLQRSICEALAHAVPMSHWITAEVSEMKINSSGHCYMELVEKGENDRIPRARAAAVIWRSTCGPLLGYFTSQTGRDLGVGMKILVRVSVSYHEVYGLTLVVTDMDPAYTVGDIERRRQETIRTLQQDGIFDMNKELSLPTVLQRIAVVSSAQAAGYRDFMQELHSSGYHFRTTLFEAMMQGNATEMSVVSALERIAASQDDFDIVVVIRGGGSVSDLSAFDSYRLCCHIAQFPLPVVTGIGHDKDVSVADMVSAVSVKTPTAAARYLIDDISEFDHFLADMQQRLTAAAVGILGEEEAVVREMGDTLYEVVFDTGREERFRLDMLLQKINGLACGIIERTGTELDMRGERFAGQVKNIHIRESMRLDSCGTLLRSFSPESILRRGFAIVRSQQGTAVSDTADLSRGQSIEITFASGSAEATISSLK